MSPPEEQQQHMAGELADPSIMTLSSENNNAGMDPLGQEGATTEDLTAVDNNNANDGTASGGLVLESSEDFWGSVVDEQLFKFLME